MNKEPATSHNTLFQRSPSHQGFDAPPPTPTRLPSPVGKTHTLRVRKESLDAFSSQQARFLSPREGKALIDVSDSMPSFLAKSPSRVKINDVSPTSSLGKTSATRNPKLMSRGSSSRSLLSRRSSLQSFDSIPTPPSRYESPAEKERGTVEMPDRMKEILVPSIMKDCGSSSTSPMKDVHHGPLEPTVSSHETSSVVGEDDVRTTVLSRIPLHIQKQLPTKEWYRILQPALLRDVDSGDCSICSDISHDFSDDDTSSEIAPSHHPGEQETSNKVYHDLYGSDDEDGMTLESQSDWSSHDDDFGTEEGARVQHALEENHHVPQMEQHSEMDSEDPQRTTEGESRAPSTQEHQGPMMAEDSDMPAAHGDEHQSSEGEAKSQESGDDQRMEETKMAESMMQANRLNSWMDAHIFAYNDIVCTDQESKAQESEGDILEQEEPKVAPQSVPERTTPCHESAPSPSAKQIKKRVSFGSAQVRWHERILDVHPCTSSGPSVGIGWNYYNESEEPIGWENQTSEELRLTRRDREEIISDLGYTSRDVAKAIRKALKVKNQRRRTINNLQANVVNVEKVEAMAENAQRKIRKLQKKFGIRRSY